MPPLSRRRSGPSSGGCRECGGGGTNRDRPGLRETLAAVREGDMLVVSKLDRLARSVPDARAIADEPTGRKDKLNIGGSVHDPTDPIGRLLFTTLSMIAKFEADLARARTREGMAVAKAKGRLRGKKSKLSPHQEATSSSCTAPGQHTTTFPSTTATLIPVGQPNPVHITFPGVKRCASALSRVTGGGLVDTECLWGSTKNDSGSRSVVSATAGGETSRIVAGPPRQGHDPLPENRSFLTR
ncbi:recombinase family protein [Rhodococcus daqingensis]|uniref:Recombinase family protein n=1 Tax=Rhodococcus daqingensis TaxID=2479363 RepID=A0ABW2RUS0_9NOCA